MNVAIALFNLPSTSRACDYVRVYVYSWLARPSRKRRRRLASYRTWRLYGRVPRPEEGSTLTGHKCACSKVPYTYIACSYGLLLSSRRRHVLDRPAVYIVQSKAAWSALSAYCFAYLTHTVRLRRGLSQTHFPSIRKS